MSSIDSLIKRMLDVILSLLGLIILSPFLLLIMVLIKLESKGPVVFRQQRLGRDAAPFAMYKFRTMQHKAPVVRNTDGTYFVGANDPRLTRVGRFLREFSLDEVPQLFNVLKGEMSLVGPRPDQVADLELYDDLLRRKLDVKPGLTNLAMIHGRNFLSWRERATWDACYIDQRCLKLDLHILCKTVVIVLLRKGVYYPEDYSSGTHG
jgi:lipopolysaccharide/colanic/teichoic acid biosynthesis glycosyltransferase